MEEKKNVFKDIKEKTAGMSFGEKLSYLWEYYRLHFLLIVFGTVFVVSLVVTVINGSLTDPVLNCGVLSEVQVYADDQLEASIQEAFPESTGYKKPQFTGVSSPANESTVMYSTAQLVTLLNANALDCLICDQETLDLMKSYELDMEVTELKDCSLTELAQSLNIPRLYYVVLTESEHPDAARKYLEYVKSMKLSE